jgi:hypothetical protein
MTLTPPNSEMPVEVLLWREYSLSSERDEEGKNGRRENTNSGFS